MTISTSALLAVVLYLTGALLQYYSSIQSFFGITRVRWQQCAFAIAFAGTIVHSHNLYQLLSNSDCGFCSNFFHSVSFTAIFTVVILILSHFNRPVSNLLTGVLPISAMAVLCNNLFLIECDNSHFCRQVSVAVILHAFISLTAYSLISIAAMQSIFLYIQDLHLKRHKSLKLISHFPPLETMERLLFEFLWAGLFMLSLSLATGFFYFQDMLFERGLLLKTVLSFLAWLLLTVLCVGRLVLGWRGVIAIKMTLTGCTLLMLAYFGGKFALEVLL